MYNEELHAETSLDTVWVIIYKDGEVVRIRNKHGREFKKLWSENQTESEKFGQLIADAKT